MPVTKQLRTFVMIGTELFFWGLKPHFETYIQKSKADLLTICEKVIIILNEYICLIPIILIID